jgi:hypothetical protein
MNTFGCFIPYGKEDIEAYLCRFSSFLFTKGVVCPKPLATSGNAQTQAEHVVLVTAYSESRKAWLLASIGPDCYAIIDNLCGARTPEDCTIQELE